MAATCPPGPIAYEFAPVTRLAAGFRFVSSSPAGPPRTVSKAHSGEADNLRYRRELPGAMREAIRREGVAGNYSI